MKRPQGTKRRVRNRELRREQTLSETILWELLRDRQLVELKFRRQHPIGPYIADFCCHEVRLIVEVDGGVHQDPSQAAHDVNRDANLAALGYTVLRFTNDQVFKDPYAVLCRITEVAFDLARLQHS
ncbi:MAG TPA: endonuclease domain-containing protein [Thermoanaerobaculia bacterium]|nr:endonuclease domain-containing protein [Thermoanaerobaculia bacterium]